MGQVLPPFKISGPGRGSDIEDLGSREAALPPCLLPSRRAAGPRLLHQPASHGSTLPIREANCPWKLWWIWGAT
jgi:hypothetical protein